MEKFEAMHSMPGRSTAIRMQSTESYSLLSRLLKKAYIVGNCLKLLTIT